MQSHVDYAVNPDKQRRVAAAYRAAYPGATDLKHHNRGDFGAGGMKA